MCNNEETMVQNQIESTPTTESHTKEGDVKNDPKSDLGKVIIRTPIETPISLINQGVNGISFSMGKNTMESH